MAVGEDVIAPVVVAALVNGNDAVAVFNAVSEHATCDGRADISSDGVVHVHDVDYEVASQSRAHGSGHSHGRATSAATITGTFASTSLAVAALTERHWY